MPELSIVVVNWNVRDLLAACLRSLEGELCHSERRAKSLLADVGMLRSTLSMT